MTEEIINGIDVSECNYFNKVVNEEPYCNIDEEHLYTCSSDENCYYKQLKRLEQENNAYKQSEQEAIEIIAELKQENRELKEVNQSLSMLGTDLVSANETVRKEFFRADKNKDMWREKAENYRSALEEIRENLVKLNTNDEDDFTYEYSKIEDKINEVLK